MTPEELNSPPPEGCQINGFDGVVIKNPFSY